MIYNILLTLTLPWQVMVVDFDDGKHIALVEGKDHNNNYKNYAVSIEDKNSFFFKEGDIIYAKIKLECANFDTFGVDEAKSDFFNQWITYTKMICNAKEITYSR